MGRHLSKFFALLMLVLVYLPSAHAANAIQVAMDGRGVPFVLDNEGHVWAFRHPLNFGSSFKLPKLEHIKKIAPFVAVDDQGRVFTWSINEATTQRDEDGLVTEVAYTLPHRTEGLRGVTMVASSSTNFGILNSLGTHYLAVIGNKEIVDWTVHQDAVSGALSYGPIRKVISREGVKAIATASWGGFIPTLSKPDVMDMANGEVALFDDGTVMGWGINQAGQTVTPRWNKAITLEEWKTRKAAAQKGVMITRSLGAIDVAMDTGHIVILTAKGIPQYWGGCAFESYQYSPSMGVAKGADGNIDGAVSMAVMSKSIFSKYDYVDADLYIKKDGSLWVAYAPSLPDVPDYCLGSTDRTKKTWSVTLGTAPVVQISRYLALDADHRVWMVGRMHKESKSVPPDPNAKLLLSPSREVQMDMN
jgi:alpha-tubulin suppressor-like RCC1 family protein